MPQWFGVQPHLQPGQMPGVVGDQAEGTRPDVAALVGDREGQTGDDRDGAWPGKYSLRRDTVEVRAVHVRRCTGHHPAARRAVNAAGIRGRSC